MNAEIEEKTERITGLLDRENLGGVLLNAQHNFAWLTGGASNGVDLSRENGVTSLFVRRDGKRFILANNIEMPRMLAEEISPDDFEAVEYSWQDEKAVGDFVINKAKSLLNASENLATDIAIHSETRSIEGLVAGCRYQLTGAEIERYRELGKDAGTVARRTIDKISPGETELEIAAKFRQELAADNIDSVVTLVAADERIAKFRHPIPTGNRWQKTLLIVTCAKRYGLIASLSRIICVGDVPDDLKIKTEAAAYVNARLWAATQPGVSGAELYKTCSEAYAEKGFGEEIDKHHQGGASGYKTREWVIHPKSEEVVQPNQAFAWNPSITGTKVEENCLLTENGVEIITASPDFPQIVSVINGHEYLSPGILSL